MSLRLCLPKMLRLSLDDLLAVAAGFLIADLTRSGQDRCLRRHGVRIFNALRSEVAANAYESFTPHEPGLLRFEMEFLPRTADETTRRYLPRKGTGSLRYCTLLTVLQENR